MYNKVVKLTEDNILCHQLYFYNKMFTADGKYLLYAKNDGKRSLYLMNLTDGSSKKLTDEDDIDDFGANLSADDKAFIYFRRGEIIRQEITTGDKKTLYTTPEGWNGYTNPSISKDNRFLVTIEMKEEDVLRSDTGSWDIFEPQFRKKPLCRIVYVDLEQGTTNIVHQEQCWLGHPQIRPNHHSDIAFCHEGPATLIDSRLWFIQANGTNLRCLRHQKPDEIITHEFWLRDGSQLAFVYRKMLGNNEVSHVNQSILYINPDTLEETHVTDCSVYCHTNTDHTGRYLVGDGQDPEHPYIFITDLHEKKERILCRHDTTWKTYGNNQDSHPHPVFTPDGSHVLFTSDKDGLPGIYMVSV